MAIRTESAAALKFWFGVGTKAVWNWRRAFGVGRLGTPGSAAAHAAASGKGAAAVRGRPVGPARQKQLRRRLMKARAAVPGGGGTQPGGRPNGLGNEPRA